jgi:sugar-specific transcriptional regulator TrmB
LSYERVLKALVGLGLSETEAEVYVLLATEGSQKCIVIAETLKANKHQVDHSLRTLQNRGLLDSPFECRQFSAVPFEKALDILIKAHLEKVQRIEQKKKEILTQWQDLMDANSSGSPSLPARNPKRG